MGNHIVFAGIQDLHRIQCKIAPEATFSGDSQIRIFCQEQELSVTRVSLTEPSTLLIEIAEPLDISKDYRIITAGLGEKVAVPFGIFDTPYFAKNFHYDGNDLGAVIHGEKTVFKIWAPTASKVILNLYADGHSNSWIRDVEMTRGEKGVWECTAACGHGTYYTYTVTTAVGTQVAADPYAKAAGLNGSRSMVADLSRTDPEGWKEEHFTPKIESYSDAIIWEVHVRDFSNKISASRYKGKYLAFTETGLVNEHGQSVGIDYLKELGITHVHLLPVYDYATVDEACPEKQFNWGYDPKNYNVPEGSYATDPYHGEVRIREYKQMVMALHGAGIGVVMDMVYNHTYDANNAFNRIVPYYYYRFSASGENTSASGCGNDTASERYMFGKFMEESTAYWVKQYHLDGLRFDLMGLHDLATMQKIETAVHALNPRALLYGEGWDMGATMDGSPRATQSNIGKIIPTGDAIGAIAAFNDVIRDALKGSTFDVTARGYINGAPEESLADILFGIQGGQDGGKLWSVPNSMVVNYMSAHDNNTLWDKLLLSNPESSEEARNRMNKLGAAILMISKGIPFWQAGEEMLRTKQGDENSYKSSDAINNIDWSALKEGSRAYETMLYYKGLIQMRKAFSVFTDGAAQITHADALGSGAVAITFDDGKGGQALAVINPHDAPLPYTLSGSWNLVADGMQAGAKVIAKTTGKVTVSGISAHIYVNDALLKETQ